MLELHNIIYFYKEKFKKVLKIGPTFCIYKKVGSIDFIYIQKIGLIIL